jgi:hypothetical protein
VTDREAVLAIIDDAARLGYAAENDESWMGVRCLGVALPFARPAIDGRVSRCPRVA